MKVFDFSQLLRNIFTAFTRFPITIISVVMLTALLQIAVYREDANTQMLLFSVLAILVSLSVYLFLENKLNYWLRNIIVAVVLGLEAIYIFNLEVPLLFPEIVRYAILVVSFLVFIFVAPFVFANNQAKHWDYVKEILIKLFTSYFFGTILMLGLSLALISLDKLFGLYIPRNTYNYLAVFCFVFFSLLYFLASLSLFDSNEESSFKNFKFINILGAYILLPILVVYAVILYLYMFKIIATWELPNGWISWLVSVFGLIGYINYFLLKPSLEVESDEQLSSQKLSRLYCRYFPLIILPFLVLMFVGLMRRVSDYDFTINRLLVLLYNLWLFGISIYFIFSNRKDMKWIFLSLFIVAMLSAIGPWSVMSISKKRFVNKFEHLLIEAGWTNSADDNLIELNEAKQESIRELGDYLIDNWGVESVRPLFNRLGAKADFVDLQKALNINSYKHKKNYEYFRHYQSKSFLIDLESYSHAIYISDIDNEERIYESDNLTLSFQGSDFTLLRNNSEVKISILDQIKWSLERMSTKNDLKDQELVVETENYKLIIYSLSGTQAEGESPYVNKFEGLLLLK